MYLRVSAHTSALVVLLRTITRFRIITKKNPFNNPFILSHLHRKMSQIGRTQFIVELEVISMFACFHFVAAVFAMVNVCVLEHM